MLPFIHHKPLSASATTSSHKKTNFSQHEKHLHEKLSSRNFSSRLKLKGPEKLSRRNFSSPLKVKGPEKLSSRNFSSCLKLKGPQHSQDGEWDASSISISQRDEREIGNFDQCHRKGQKISIISEGAKPSGRSVIHLARRFPQIFPQRKTKNKQQLYVTMESVKNKLEADENKLDNHYDDPEWIVNKNWYKVLWRKFKKQAKRIANSEAVADSAFDETISQQRKILQMGHKWFIDTCVTRRDSGSRNKLNKHFLPNENSAFPGSEDVEVKIESSDRVTFRKITPSVQTCMILESDIVYNNPLTLAVSSHVSIPDQRNIQPVEVKRKSLKMSKSTHFENRNNEEKTDSLGDETQNLHKEKESNIQPVQVKKKFLTMSNSTHPEGRDATRLMPEQKLSKLSDDWINVLLDEVQRNFINMSKSRQPEDSLANFKLLVDITASSDKTGKEQVDWKKDNDSVLLRQERNGADAFSDVLFTGHQMFSVNKLDSLTRFTLPYEIASLHGKKGEELKEDSLTRFTLPYEIASLHVKKEEELKEDSLTRFKLQYEIASVLGKKVEELKEDSLTRFILPYVIASLLGKKGEELKEIKNVSAGERSKQESTPVKLYRNVVQNETCRMMTGIDMIVFEAKRLFGNERTQIFFDLLDDGLFCFGLSGAAPSFIPNMTQSTVRQHVISFFEHSCDTMNRLMTLLLGCPDSKILQQMPEQHFISLMRSVIDSSLKAKTKGGKILSLKESTFIMVDSEEFERALGEDIPEDVLDRLKHGEEVVAQKFVDTKIGITQASEGRENSPIHFIYFPSDCHLFIYIPTEKGSYWHQMNMQRENRIRRHNK